VPTGIFEEDIVAERKVTVECEVGLHARPAATFVQTAAKAPIDVTVAKVGGAPVNAKSILSVLSLDVRQGESIVIRADGDGADELLEALAAIASAP
jgi:phosphocarrier protein HPr